MRNNSDTTKRFSDRVAYYVKYRPDYPDLILKELKNTIGLMPSWVIADMGSGTGKSTLPFLKNGNLCYGIEPNTPMREAAEKYLVGFPNFLSINATAEQTSLSTHSVDLIVVGQAFHWFDITKVKTEFTRILKPGGWGVLMWNIRLDAATPFMKAYNDFLLAYSTDYSKVNLRRIDADTYQRFFNKEGFQFIEVPNLQHFDLEGLIGRYLSCSYAFDEGHSKHQEAMEALSVIFKRFAEEERIPFHYSTRLYFGKLF